MIIGGQPRLYRGYRIMAFISAFQAEDRGSIPLTRSNMKYLFFVQGEGRGHFSQALTLREKLESRGHTVTAMIIGSSGQKPVPVFFINQIKPIPFVVIDSPHFIADKKNKGVKIFLSSLLTVWQTPKYLKALKKINQTINLHQPDVLINFYESMAGNYYRFYRDPRPMFCIAHQYFIHHPAFNFPPLRLVAKLSFKFFNHFTAPRRATRLALSFSEESDQVEKRLFICPPLIRQAIKNETPKDEGFILTYLLNAGYGEEITAWCKNNPTQKVEAFWDKCTDAETHVSNNLIFHYLNGQKFIDHLAACSAYASTAGFDSIAEAAYLQKSVLMIPTKNHFEQKCNAADAERVGLAITAPEFDLSLLTEKLQKTHSLEAQQCFKKWVDNFDDKIVSILEK